MSGAATAKQRRITRRELKAIDAPRGMRDSQPLMALAPLLEDITGRLGVGVGLSVREGASGESKQVFMSERYRGLMNGPAMPLLEDTIAMRFDGTEVQLRLLAPDDRDEKLDRLAKMAIVGEVSAGMAHDFRNVLTVLMGNLELLKAVLPPGGTTAPSGRGTGQFLAEMETAIEMGMGICDRFEGLASTKRRVRTGSLSDIAASAVAMVRDRIKRSVEEGRDIVIENRASEEIEVVSVPFEVQMAMINIMFNAIRYCGTGGDRGVITLDSYKTGRHAVLAIWNNGPPIPPGIQKTLLQKPLASAAVHGYGLFTAAENLKSFGADLSFSSGPEGTTFLITLPLAGKSDGAAEI